MNTLSKAALGLLSSGVVGLGGWGLYLKFGISGFSSEELELLKSLNIPTNDCNDYGKSCDLSSEEHGNIKFSDGTNNDLKIPSDKTVKLNIEKPKGEEAKVFGDNGMKFNLIFSGGSGDIEIKDSNNNNNKKITLKPNTNYEFKKKAGGQLERAWSSGEEIAKKIGFGNASPSGTTRSFSLSRDSINVYKDGKKYKNTTAITTDKSKNIEINEGVEGVNNGFKFSTPDNITLETKDKTNITLEKGKEYEIKFIDDDWYLVLKEVK